MKQSPQERLLERARTPDDAAALAKFDAAAGLPLVLAAVLPLLILPGGEHYWVATIVNVVAWLVFVVDFVVHERRLRHYLATWTGRFDLFVVVVTAPWFLIFGPSGSTFVVVIRLARIARLLMAGKGARRLFARVGRVAVVALAVVFIGAAMAYRAEHHTNSEFATYGDALWWAIVTLTTVGYGDIVPKTTAGRVDGVMIMVTGIAVLGVLAGSLASFFRIETPQDESAPPMSAAPDIATELVAMRAQVALLTEQVGQLVRRGGTEPPG